MKIDFAGRSQLDFADINKAALSALPALVARWLPGGRAVGSEYIVRNPRRPDCKADSFKINLRTGRWADFASGDRGGDPISLVAYIHGMSQGDADGSSERCWGCTMADDAFAALSDEEINAAPASKPASNGQVIAPVPEDAPAMKLTLNRRPPDQQWEYRDEQGQLLGDVLRFDQPDGSKEIRPATYCTHAELPSRWRYQGFTEPRPLYGLDRLACHPKVPVIVCEGEKAADAAARIFQDHVCITSNGGAKAADKTDWSALSGRKVWIWPDADAAGAGYANSVVNCLWQAKAASVAVVDVNSMSDGWDLADELPGGVDTDDLLAMLDTAAAQDISLEIPEGYELRADGWYYKDKFIAGRFEIVVIPLQQRSMGIAAGVV